MRYSGVGTRITLLSASARRREIVGAAFPNAAIEGSRGEEPRPEPGEGASEYVVRSALAKLGDLPANVGARQSIAGQTPGGVLLSADTVVALEGEILGKPASPEEARSMLELLSDGWHQVVTGVAVADGATGRTLTGVETSDVRTRSFSDAEIDAYVASGEPFDKAGGYAVQDESFRPVVRADGCYLNIVGLPLCVVTELLQRLGAKPGLRDLESVPYHDGCRDCRLIGPTGSSGTIGMEGST